jgi:hypothetical protein
MEEDSAAETEEDSVAETEAGSVEAMAAEMEEDSAAETEEDSVAETEAGSEEDLEEVAAAETAAVEECVHKENVFIGSIIFRVTKRIQTRIKKTTELQKHTKTPLTWLQISFLAHLFPLCPTISGATQQM